VKDVVMSIEAIAFFPPIKLLGLLGAGFYILSYVLLTSRVLSSEHGMYFALNLAASTLVMISLSHEFNAASAVIQTFWIVVSLWGLLSRFGRRRPAPMPTGRLRPLG
jgi:hypothetical protein